MLWSEELEAYTYQCPCGDLFQITTTDLKAGEEIAKCPSCTLVVRVVYDPDDFDEEKESLSPGEVPPLLKCLVPREH